MRRQRIPRSDTPHNLPADHVSKELAMKIVLEIDDD